MELGSKEKRGTNRKSRTNQGEIGRTGRKDAQERHSENPTKDS